MTQVATTATTQKPNIMAQLQATPPNQLAASPILQDRFVTLYQKTQGVSVEQAAMIFETEKYHFQKLLAENQGLRECDSLSLYGAFIDIAVQGLSIDPKKKLCYLIPGSVNIGTKDDKKYIKRAALEVSPYGELAIRQLKRQIKYADNPVIVYEGDVFEPYQDASGKGVNFKMNVNHGTKIIGAFIRIVKMDNTEDFHWMVEADWKRLMEYSKKKNNGYPNALYSSMNGGIDPGFLGAKLIKHAFKSYPKVDLSNFSVESKDNDDPNDDPKDDPNNIYGFNPNQLPIPEKLPEPTYIAQAAIPSTEGLTDDAARAVVQAHAEPVAEQPGTFDDDSNSGF